MSADADLIKLYSARILDLAANIPHLGRLDSPKVSIARRAPLCGSTVTVDLTFANGAVSEFSQDVKACALGQASAAIVGQNIIGNTRQTVQIARDQLKAMLAQNGPIPDAPFEGLEVLIPARDYANRHASILLVLDAVLEGFDSLKSAD